MEEKAQEIAKLTFYDEIIDLSNKAFMLEWLVHANMQAKLNEQAVGIDRFKKINESLWYSQGDKVLRTFAVALLEFTRKADAVFRVSGDVFCAVLHCDKASGGTS